MTLLNERKGRGKRGRDFTDQDADVQAIRDLTGAGLIHRHGPFVFATRAAVRSLGSRSEPGRSNTGL